MGMQNKLLLRLPESKTILASTLTQAVVDGVGPVIVVTEHEEVAREADGLLASLRAGHATVPEDCPGVLICLGDMLFVSASLNRVDVDTESVLNDIDTLE